ncbi:MAG: hypothetical protein J7K21_07155 [Desulfurococcales archaeon]|nr:hypothetical protein [Desulfurococcales archaeon]
MSSENSGSIQEFIERIYVMLSAYGFKVSQKKIIENTFYGIQEFILLHATTSMDKTIILRFRKDGYVRIHLSINKQEISEDFMEGLEELGINISLDKDRLEGSIAMCRDRAYNVINNLISLIKTYEGSLSQ